VLFGREHGAEDCAAVTGTFADGKRITVAAPLALMLNDLPPNHTPGVDIEQTSAVRMLPL
jgi:hypothetical protein